jgi:hypothetical protein
MATKRSKQPKVTIRENVWGNWYGYISGRRVEQFFNTPFATQQQNAEKWQADTIAGFTELGMTTKEYEAI